MRVALVQMPFGSLDTPSIGLSLLKAVLEQAGHTCDIKYLNLELGERLGVELYSFIASSTTHNFLLGDLVFASCLHDDVPAINVDRMRSLSATPFARGGRPLAEPVIEAFPQIAATAKTFITDVVNDATANWASYDLIGVGAAFTIAPVLAFARELKLRSKRESPPIILGGPYMESEMGETLFRLLPFIDYVARGEGEKLIVDLVARLALHQKEDLNDIKGLLWRDANGDVRVNGESAATYPGKATLLQLGKISKGPPPASSSPGTSHKTGAAELDALPIPRYDDWLAEMRTRKLLPDAQLRLPLQTSRGCWYGEKHHCTFCGLNDATIAYRRKSPERALEEFRELVKYGVGGVHSVDDILDFRYFKTFLPELAKITHNVEIFFEVKSNLSWADVDLLRRAGVAWIQPGIESLSTPVLDLMDKGVTAIQNARLLRYAAEHGIGMSWNMLCGFPGEEPAWFDAIAAIVPSLAHLQPPYFADCERVRMERFSPLYVNRDAQDSGLKNVRPSPAYSELYPFPEETVSKLAFYFEHDYATQPDPSVYVGPLTNAIAAWHAEIGTACFLSIGSGTGTGSVIELLDTRRCAVARSTRLVGLEAEVYAACAHGASLAVLERAMPPLTPQQTIIAILESFLERRWILELDDTFVTLAVPADARAESLPAYLPKFLRDESLIRFYCDRNANIFRTEVPMDPACLSAIPTATDRLPTDQS